MITIRATHLRHDIGRSDRRDTLHLEIVRHLLQRRRDLDLVFGEFLGASSVLGLALVGLALETALPNRAPGGDGHAFLATHGEEIALEIADRGGPAALVDHLRRR